MLLYRHPRIEVIVAGGAVRRADGAVIGSTAVEPDPPVQGRLRDHRRIRDRRGGHAAGLRLSRGPSRTGHHRECAQRDAGGRQHEASAHRAGAHRPYQPDPDIRHRRALPAGLANICHSRGIEVIEAMPTHPISMSRAPKPRRRAWFDAPDPSYRRSIGCASRAAPNLHFRLLSNWLCFTHKRK